MKRKTPTTTKSLIIQPAALPEETRKLIQIATPREFIRQRAGRGNKTFTYVEGGYVIARLNQIFSPVGWDFEIVDERIEQKEVVVRGKLTIKDHKNGYEISKTQYGTKERYAGVPLGDTLKAAATDCLKKCASLFGIALDVYWQQLDEDKLTNGLEPKKQETPKTPSKNASTPQKAAQFMKLSLDKIKSETDKTILLQFAERIKSSSLYSPEQKTTLINAIGEQIKKYASNENQKLF